MFEACDLTFLDLSGVDDAERRRVLSSLQDSSGVRLPWKNTRRKAPQTPSPQLPVEEHSDTIMSPQYHQVFIPIQTTDYNSVPIPMSYPVQPPLVMYAAPMAPNYQPPFPIINNNIAVLNYPQQSPNHHFVNCNNTHHQVQLEAPTLISSPPQRKEPPVPAAPSSQVEASPRVVEASPKVKASPRTEPSPRVQISPIFEASPKVEASIAGASPKVEASPTVMVTPEVSSPKVSSAKNAEEPSVPVNQQNGAAPKAKTVWGTPKAWSSIYKSDAAVVISNGDTMNDNVKSQAVKETNNNGEICPIRHPQKTTFVDPVSYRMAEYLLDHSVDGRTISLQPRGLINRSNYCYINSILQALLACPPVYNLLSGLAKQNSNMKDRATPIIDGMCRFVREFQHLPAGQRVNRRNDKNHKKDNQNSVSIDCDLPFEPSWIYKLLNGIRSDSFLVEGRQEDAEEFLGCLLNGMNDEMLDLLKIVRHHTSNGTTAKRGKSVVSVAAAAAAAAPAAPAAEEEEDPLVDDSDREWQVMGPRNKGGVTRHTEFARTPVSDIFGGSLKSRIHRAGDHPSYNIQPFFTLPLNIEKVKTVREALEALTAKNQLEGVTSSKTNEEVEAWQQVTLEELPVILVLHLKCFDFKPEGCTKIVKALEFPIDLKIDAKLLSSKPTTPKEKQYKLFAVVYHDGKETTKGHYVTDAFHVGYSSWLRYDDSSVKTVQEDQVLKPQGTRVPYLLFYRRSDTIRSK